MAFLNSVCKLGQLDALVSRFFVINHQVLNRRLSLSCPYRYPVELAYTTYKSSDESSTADVNTTAKTILIMHGLFGSKNNWNTLAKSIHQKTKRKVVAVDARNHGESPHSPDMTYEYMAKDIVQLMKNLQLRKATLVGHSMGGSAVMYTALNYPELVEKLVVVDMSPVRTSESLVEMNKIFDAMLSIKIEPSASLSLSETRKLVDRQLSTSIHSQNLRQFLLTNLAEDGPGKYKWRVNLPVLAQHFKSQISAPPKIESKVYTGPTLFVGGAKSDYIKKDDHSQIRNLFPHAEFQYIEGAGHWLHAEKPAEFLDIVVNFINKS